MIREDTPAVNPGRKAAFGLAVNMFVEEPRLDLDLIEEELGLPAATVEGWWPTREVLLAEVLDHFADLAFNRAEAETVNMQGLDRVLAVGRIYIGLIVTFEPLRRFFRAESQVALEILTTPGEKVQSGVVDRVTKLLQFEHETHGMELRAPAETLAYAVTRMIEGFIYNDPLADIEPDVDQAIVILGLLLE